MTQLHIEIIPALADNYIYLLHDEFSGKTLVIDPSEADPVLEHLQRNNWRLTYIFNTHHHHDHVGGNMRLKRRTGCVVVGYRGDEGRIPGMDIGMGDGEVFSFCEHKIHAMHVPGHTSGALAYYIPSMQVVFTGDTLFQMGCGRLFEGTPEEMYHSLQKFAALPKETRIYTGHEYAHGNARFALTVEPNNEVLQQRLVRVANQWECHQPNQGTSLADELATNPFLRTDNPEIRKIIKKKRASDIEVLAELRKRKDSF